jgi:hypothetical protein
MLTPVPDLIYGALAEIRVARGGDVTRAEDQALCLTFLNEVLERLAVTPHALFARAAVNGLLTPGLRPHTIGPTGTFVVPQRPVRIGHALVTIPPATNHPIPLKSAAWLIDQPLPFLQSPYPEGLYYDPIWPNGELWLWPVPSMAYLLGLEWEVAIAAVAAADAIDLPQGYSELLRLWTAKKAAPSFAREFSSASQAALTECLSDVFGTNIGRVNDADTRDGGVPRGSGAGRGGTYDYRTGLVS